MTGTKLWRLSLAAILAFGWLFLIPAQGVPDQITAAAEDIAELNSDVNNLVNKTATQNLIDIAESKYDAAVAAKTNLETKQSQYDSALATEAAALVEKNNAQSAVDTQTVIRNTANTNRQNKLSTYNAAQTALDAHIATYGTGGAQGVSFQIFPLSRSGNYAYIASGAGVMCQGSIPTFDAYAGWGSICYLSQNIIGIFRATLTVPANVNSVYFAAATDDGSRIYVNQVLEAELWEEQGTTWGPYTRVFDTTINKTLNLEVWWYNGGGPGNLHVGWGQGGMWSGIPAELLTWGTPLSQEILAERQTLQADRNTKYSEYQSALTTYNAENSKLTQYQNTLTTKTTAYNNAVTAKTNASNALSTATTNYNTAILEMQEAVIDAQEEYAKQWNFEEAQRVAAAIAQALANQPQPTPEPTPEVTPEPSLEPSPEPSPESSVEPTPSPEPSPEQTEPVDPTPEPSSDATDEPKPEPTPESEPTPEPSPEPSPQPTGIDPETTPEPEPTPDEPSEESSDNSTTEDLTRVIANLTSKDNVVVKLTPEQMAAVSNTLTSLTTEAKIEVAKDFGIKADEIAVIAKAAKDNPAIAAAVVTFAEKAKENADALMPYTLADAITEAATEQLLADPIGALTNIDLDKVLNPSEWGKDMTDDQREKAQEVIVPVIIASNIVAAAMTRRI